MSIEDIKIPSLDEYEDIKHKMIIELLNYEQSYNKLYPEKDTLNDLINFALGRDSTGGINFNLENALSIYHKINKEATMNK